jgi:two-component system phosphate regulon sensor histidine kinase PhoR
MLHSVSRRLLVKPGKLSLPQIQPHIRPLVAALAAVAAQIVLTLPVWDWGGRAAIVATAAGVAIAALAGAYGGLLAGVVAGGAGWILNFVFVADADLAAVLALPAWLAAGAVAGWLVDRFDEASRERRLAERRWQFVQEAASDAILRIDTGGVITGWSPGAEALYGYLSREIVRHPFAELVGGGDPAERTDEIVDSVRRRQRVTDDVMVHRKRDGSTFSASVTVIPTADDDGEPLDALVVTRDVGELKRVTEDFREVEARYRSLTEHLPVVTYVRSLTGNEDGDFVSPQIDRLLGYTADEWLADSGLFLRLVHPDDRERVAAARDEVDTTKGVRSTYRMLSRDGRVVWVRDEAVAVLDEAGRPLCIQGYMLDLSERKAAEAERNDLRAAEAAAAAEARDRQRKIDFVAEAGSVLASSLDVRTTVGQVTELAVRDLAESCVVDRLEEDGGVTRFAAALAEPVALSTEPEPHPEPGVREVIDELRDEVSESQIRVPLVSRGRRALGALTLVAGDHAAPYAADDVAWARAVAGMIALAIEKARLHAEVETRSDANKVLTHVGDGVFLVDRGGLIRLWNRAAAAITGVSAETAVGKAASDAIPGWQELGERVPLGTVTEPARAEALPLDTDRGERWISISGVEFFGGTVYAFRDITEAHQLDELKAEFIATASHELRTPLAAVYGAAQTLRRHDFALDDAGRERFISLIVDESDRLARIVNQILLANQLEVGRLDLVTAPFDAADMVERVVESARTHAPPHITFDIKVADGVPPVAADKDRARQVLTNLVENAVKYSPGGGKIELALEPSDGAVLFRVADEGMGIPEDEQRRIFEKFYRLDPNMTQGIGGTGLGLYICSELVERMGGRIWLESEEGKGSAFYFELPSVTAPPVLPKTRDHSEGNGAGSTPPAQVDAAS